MSLITANMTDIDKRANGQTMTGEDIVNNEDIANSAPDESDSFLSALLPNDTEQAIVDALTFTFEECKAAAADINTKRDRMENLYNGNYNHEGKEDWQAQNNLPVVKMGVEKLAATMTRMLTLSRKDWFSVYSYCPGLRPLYGLCKEMVQESLDHPKVKFHNVFKNSVTNAQIYMNPAVFVSWKSDDDPVHYNFKESESTSVMFDLFGLGEGSTEALTEDYISRSYPMLINDNPRNVLLDPTGRNRYKIRYWLYTKGEFREDAEKPGNDWANVEKVLASSPTDKETEISKNHKGRGVDENKISRKDDIKIMEFWGDLYDEEGDLLLKNSYLVLANDQFLVLQKENPFYHGELPIITCNMISNPCAVYSESHISSALDTLETWVSFLNMMIDFYQTRILPQYEINVNNLEGEDSVDKVTGYPGKYWEKSGPEPLITSVTLSDLPPNFALFIQMLKGQMGEDTGLQDISSINFPSNQQSIDEGNRRMVEAGNIFDHSFKELEENFITPILRQTFINMLQYTPDDEWKQWVGHKIARHIEKALQMITPQEDATLQQQFPDTYEEEKKKLLYKKDKNIALFEEVQDFSADKRLEVLGKQIYFKTEVLSSVFDRKAFMDRVIFVMNTASRNPMVMAKINQDYFLKKMMRVMSFDEDEAILDDDKAKEILSYMMQMGLIKSYFRDDRAKGDTQGTNQPSSNPMSGMAEAVSGMGGMGEPPQGWNSPMPPQQ